MTVVKLGSRLVLAASIVAAALLTVGCGDNQPAAATPVLSAITLTAAPNGNVLQVTATAVYSFGPTRNVTGEARWESSNTTVVEVTQTGGVTAVGPGRAEIRATYQGVVGVLALCGIGCG
jgi:hypothetical protein